jgi:4-amino-4-deoxy-L-arabinose transferase-like glycosyltransferase
MLLFGDSPFAVRILPSFAHAGTVIAAGLIAKKMGGEKFAQLLSALIIGFAPGFLGIMGIYSMNAFDIFLWSVAFFLLLQLIETKESAYWIALGFIIGEE